MLVIAGAVCVSPTQVRDRLIVWLKGAKHAQATRRARARRLAGAADDDDGDGDSDDGQDGGGGG